MAEAPGIVPELSRTDISQLYKLLEARFDHAAKLYDAGYGSPSDSGRGNSLLGWMRQQHLDTLRTIFPAGAAVLDVGCGTGEESLALVRDGFSVLGIDISPVMVRQAQTKAAVYGVTRGLIFHALPAGRIGDLDERGPFQGAFAGLGTLNTEPNLPAFASGLHDLLEPGAPLVATVMNRACLYERLFASGDERLKRSTDWAEARAGSGGVVAPVRFYAPDEFAAFLAPYFTVEDYWAFPLWLPPVHLADRYNADPDQFARRVRWDVRMRHWSLFRGRGDHFMMVLRRTE